MNYYKNFDVGKILHKKSLQCNDELLEPLFERFLQDKCKFSEPILPLYIIHLKSKIKIIAFHIQIYINAENTLHNFSQTSCRAAR
jgi:hypothetical protein